MTKASRWAPTAVFIAAFVTTLLLVGSQDDAHAEQFETFHPYLEDNTDNKGFRGTRVDYGPWQHLGPLSALYVDWTDSYTSIWYPQYEFDYLGFYRGGPCNQSFQPIYRAVHISEQTTPRYDRHNYNDYMDDTCDRDITFTTGVTDQESALAFRLVIAWIEVTVPYNSLDAYQSGSGQTTTFP